MTASKPFHRYLELAALIFAGEVIFSLPFHITRFFRPTFLDVFQLSNTQLGDAFAVYGVVAMLAYFPGGVIADHFSARKLMATSLISTALGGFYLYTLPSVTGLFWLFGFFGLTTILLFWAAMIKSIRNWGGSDAQGVAFGVLEGGRGLVASLAASLALIIFATILNEQSHDMLLKKAAIQQVILFYSLATLLAACIVWWIVPHRTRSQLAQSKVSGASTFEGMSSVIKNQMVWLQGGIIVAAYCGYKALDNYGLYAVEVMGLNAVESAKLTTIGSYTRPIVAIGAGLIADRISSSKTVTLLFTLATLVFFTLGIVDPKQVSTLVILGNLLISAVAVFSLRGIYFALIEESKIKAHMTGTAVGLISVIGYTPDIFFAAITGRILYPNPGLVGFQHYFLSLTGVALLGMILTVFLSRKIKHL